MPAVPYIDDSPAARRLDRHSTTALQLALVPWLLCAMGVLAFVTGHRPPAALLAPGWLIGLFVGITGALLAKGLHTRRAKLAAVAGFTAPLFTIVPTGFLVLYGMAGWCC
jgi:hypothetical protein